MHPVTLEQEDDKHDKKDEHKKEHKKHHHKHDDDDEEGEMIMPQIVHEYSHRVIHPDYEGYHLEPRHYPQLERQQ